MMNKIIQQQLEKIQIADLSKFDKEANTYFIPKYMKPKYDIGKCYLVKLNKNIINDTKSVLAINWNSGTAPKAEYYKIYINNVAGKMIKVDGLEYNFEMKSDGTNIFSGWLDINDLTQIDTVMI